MDAVCVSGEVTFDDAALHAVVADMGGTSSLADSSEGIAFLKAEFAKRYLGYLARGETFEYPAVLTWRSAAGARYKARARRTTWPTDSDW